MSGRLGTAAQTGGGGGAHLDQSGVQVDVVRHDDGAHDAHGLGHLDGPAALAGRQEHPPEQLRLVGSHPHVLGRHRAAGRSEELLELLGARAPVSTATLGPRRASSGATGELVSDGWRRDLTGPAVAVPGSRR